ncbi:MAG TPA: mechanosensitive ion channel domain-containing protein [Flavobacterium sp.]|jgi:small conductance mechanosensitive channel
MNLDPYYISDYAKRFITILVDYSPRLIAAFLILIIGIYAIRFINKLVRKLMVKRNLDPTLSKFLADILIWVLRVLLFVSFISKLGIETSSFVAILGAAGLAVGLSLQGSLSNFAGGMLIILFKPFRVGDYIEAQGVSGTVAEIQIFVTKLINFNNQTIFVPNGALSNGNIVNYSIAGIRRADFNFTVSYDVDLKVVKDIIFNILENDQKVLKEPEATIEVVALLDNGVRIAVRPWATNEDFGIVYAHTLENIKTELYKAGIALQPYIKESSV